MGKKRRLDLIQESNPGVGESGEECENSVTSELKISQKNKLISNDHTKSKVSLRSEILEPEGIEIAKSRKKKKAISEFTSTPETNDDVPKESSNVKKLRFNIDGETVDSGKEASKDEKGLVKKVRKPRWSEERKVEERKRKADEQPAQTEEQPKIKKKKKHKKTKKPLNQKSSQDLPTAAIQYLQTWQYDRSSWKFSKFKQTWLLKNIFDLRKIPSSIFPVLVEYISGSHGGARLKTYQAASKVIENLEEENGKEAKTEEEEITRCLTEESEEDKEEIHQRARSIMQALSDCT